MGSWQTILGHNNTLCIFFEYNVYSGCLLCGLEWYAGCIEGYKSLLLISFREYDSFWKKCTCSFFSSHLQED